MDIKILIDGKEYTIEEARELKYKLDEILKQETLPYYTPINIPFQREIWPWWEVNPNPTYTISTSGNSEPVWNDMPAILRGDI